MILLEDINKINKTFKINRNGNDFLTVINLKIENYSNISSHLTDKTENGILLKKADSFIIDSLIRVLSCNNSPFKINSNDKELMDYPVFLSVKLDFENNSEVVYPLDIFPRTLNSEVNTSVTNENSSSNSTSYSHTSGSNSSQSNSFGINMNYSALQGLSGGADYRHTWENGKNNSTTNGRDLGFHIGKSLQTSMSIKDWSSYGSIKNKGKSVEWFWGQSYPWDVIQFNKININNEVVLPNHIKQRLMIDSNTLAQPSHLSMFGLDFLMTAKWIIEMPDTINKENCLLNINNIITCQKAKHLFNNKNVAAKFTDQITDNFRINAIDLYEVSLTNISENQNTNPAIISLDTEPYIYFNDTTFRINSSMNNLLIDGKGFKFSKNQGFHSDLKKDTEINIKFKVIDNVVNYNLILMHWVLDNKLACKLTIEVNDHEPIQLMIDYTEGKGGQNNRTEISLRNNDFRSVNFHDYLNIGLNNIKIKFDPINPAGANFYKLFGLAITV